MTASTPLASDRYARAALRNVCGELAATASGRNAKLNGAAYGLGRFVGGGHLGRHEVEEALLDAAGACGYVQKDGAAQARATIRSGLERGMQEPRDPPAADAARAYQSPDPEEAARLAQDREQARLQRESEDQAKAEFVVRTFDEAARDPRPHLSGRYFREHRGIELPPSVCGHALRFHPRGPWEGARVPMVLGALRCILTDRIVGLHRTRLDPTTAAKVDRKMLGRAKGAAIKLSPDAEVGVGLHIAEGIESALAGMTIGLAPMWAMGSVGGIAGLPVLPGVEALTICAEAGEASAAAVEQVGNRWSDAGREVRICRPARGSDLNDAIREATR